MVAPAPSAAVFTVELGVVKELEKIRPLAEVLEEIMLSKLSPPISWSRWAEAPLKIKLPLPGTQVNVDVAVWPADTFPRNSIVGLSAVSAINRPVLVASNKTL